MTNSQPGPDDGNDPVPRGVPSAISREAARIDALTANDPSAFVLKGLFVLALLYTFHFARAVLLPIVLAVLFTLIFSPVVRELKRMRVPEPLGAAIVVIALLGLTGIGVFRLLDPANEWIQRLPQTLDHVERKVRDLHRSMDKVTRAAQKVDEIAGAQEKPARGAPQVVAREPGLVSRVMTGTQNAVVSAVSTIVLFYFLLASGDMFLRKAVRVLPTMRDKRTAVGVARTIQTAMTRYLFTVTCINCGMGFCVGAGLYLMDMPNPVLWGVMVAVLHFIPYLGAAVGFGVISVVAFITFDDPVLFARVPLMHLGLEIVEGQLVTPILTGRSLTLNPVMIFVAMLFWGWMWGVAGALIAVPVLMTVKIFCDHIPSLFAIGEFLGGQTPVEPAENTLDDNRTSA